MSNVVIDPKKQFSKKLARWTAVFWFFYMTWLSVITFMRPEAALYCVYMGILVTAVMLLNVWAYTKNSVYEKGVFAMLEKAKFDVSMSGISKTVVSKATKGEKEDEEDLNGKESNG